MLLNILCGFLVMSDYLAVRRAVGLVDSGELPPCRICLDGLVLYLKEGMLDTGSEEVFLFTDDDFFPLQRFYDVLRKDPEAASSVYRQIYDSAP